MKIKFLAVSLLIVAFLLPSIVSAQDDDGYEWKVWKTKRSHAGFSGHGGPMYSVLFWESSDLDKLAKAMGLEEMSHTAHGMGGYGMGHVGNGWRLGGGGYGFSSTSSGIYTDTNGNRYNRSMELTFGGGVFYIEYSPWMIGPINFGVGTGIGGGGATVTLKQDNGTVTWEDIQNQYIGDPSSGTNIESEILRGYFLMDPYTTVRVFVLDWMAVEGRVGFYLNTLSEKGWYFGTDKMAGNGVDISINKPYFSIGLVFGG